MNLENKMITKLLNAKQVMEILNISRAHFYTKIIIDDDFKQTVKPVCLVRNGLKQYKQSELQEFINTKQQKTD
jgi:predicted DNA-binding transcriptional regulator AlpA